MLMSTLVGFSQTPKDEVVVANKITVDLRILTLCIEQEINRVRKENGLDTLSIKEELRTGALRNSTTCADKPGIYLGHTEKGNFSEIAIYELDRVLKFGTTQFDRVELTKVAKCMIAIWMMSPRHKKIMLQKNIKYMGSGTALRMKIVKEESYICDRKNRGPSIPVIIDSKEYYIWASVRFN